MIAALYVRARSIYHQLPGVDPWCAARDARLYPGPWPVIAHPPCRGWGKYAYRAKCRPGETDLAFHALEMVRLYGGVLEHPQGSQFWRAGGLPRPGAPPDAFGGWSLLVNQVDWGHRALKPTLLYICGTHFVPPSRPARSPSSTVENMWRGEREATPKDFAIWLCQIAQSVARA
ncbi:MAG TPA: hypothetical protein PKA35_04310 [Paracoccus solventivorans]|uniref:hypothetical protein n=1 Tax=Paracoccus solventivorans TaxID=53463 RepID=UPI002C78026D|nr:hypothetical protein [Paracoccus solventivorans]HMM08328.1 hypothetical protein [Paracoccus solventivorans]